MFQHYRQCNLATTLLHVKNIQLSTLTTLRDIYFETNFYHPSSI